MNLKLGLVSVIQAITLVVLEYKSNQFQFKIPVAFFESIASDLPHFLYVLKTALVGTILQS